ncbi:hypothetical protein GPECTOR_4g875 [Gonium pectorale]|uniref:Uncharacterized protein n=1 Tax=Gonium pectorale TaxID=33097 RepID=A0A150GYD1_GONPE|nr:hypothetical protein GPECTOR_4g875 [Gonium pectorale]|eukprot:KXZ54804.1 hypothetical protein GPECTOR_4g875 [Gonium pectorale]
MGRDAAAAAAAAVTATAAAAAAATGGGDGDYDAGHESELAAAARNALRAPPLPAALAAALGAAEDPGGPIALRLLDVDMSLLPSVVRVVRAAGALGGAVPAVLIQPGRAGSPLLPAPPPPGFVRTLYQTPDGTVLPGGLSVATPAGWSGGGYGGGYVDDAAPAGEAAGGSVAAEMQALPRHPTAGPMELARPAAAVPASAPVVDWAATAAPVAPLVVTRPGGRGWVPPAEVRPTAGGVASEHATRYWMTQGSGSLDLDDY